MNDNTNEYLNLPYQDQDKYTESGRFQSKLNS